MKILKVFFILILIGLIFSGGDYSNSRVLALVAGGGGTSGFGGAGGGGVGSIAGNAGVYIAAAQAALGAIKANCGMAGGPSSFGGRIKKACKCKDGGIILTIGGPRGGNYYFGKGSILYLFGALKPGLWVLGQAGGTKVCFDLLKKPRPMSGKTIRPIGTSK